MCYFWSDNKTGPLIALLHTSSQYRGKIEIEPPLLPPQYNQTNDTL